MTQNTGLSITLTEEDREWISGRAYDLYRGWSRNNVTQDIREQDGIDYWIVNATVERVQHILEDRIDNGN